MYLSERREFARYESLATDPDYKAEYDIASQVLDAIGMDYTPDGTVGVDVTVVYWRKANHIHQWFVDNVQNGVDDCDSYDVSREQLDELLQTAKSVRSNHELAEVRLPTSDGFFFGAVEYDNWYFEDVELTIEGLTKVLASAPEDSSFTYRASW